MSEEKSLDFIKKFWPKNAPDITSVPKYIQKYSKRAAIIHYCGGP